MSRLISCFYLFVSFISQKCIWRQNNLFFIVGHVFFNFFILSSQLRHCKRNMPQNNVPSPNSNLCLFWLHTSYSKWTLICIYILMTWCQSDQNVFTTVSRFRKRWERQPLRSLTYRWENCDWLLIVLGSGHKEGQQRTCLDSRGGP